MSASELASSIRPTGSTGWRSPRTVEIGHLDGVNPIDLREHRVGPRQMVHVGQEVARAASAGGRSAGDGQHDRSGRARPSRPRIVGGDPPSRPVGPSSEERQVARRTSPARRSPSRAGGREPEVEDAADDHRRLPGRAPPQPAADERLDRRSPRAPASQASSGPGETARRIGIQSRPDAVPVLEEVQERVAEPPFRHRQLLDHRERIAGRQAALDQPSGRD